MVVKARAITVSEPVTPIATTGPFAAADVDRREQSYARVALAAVSAIPLLALVICIAATRTAALVPESVRPTPSWLAGPLHYLGFQLPAGIAITMVLLMFGAYLVAVRQAEHLSTRAVMSAVLAFNMVVLLGPPVFSTDLFSYQAYARMFTAYHTNPYTHGPSAMSLDYLYNFIGAKWIATPSVYGPLFTLMSGALASASVAFSALAFKLLAVLCSLTIAALLWRAAKLRDVNPTTAVAIYGLNPVVTLFAVGGAHNDLLMLLFFTFGIYALLRQRELSGGAAIIAAAATKLTGGVLLPFALAAGGPEPGARSARRRVLVGALVSAVAIGVPSFLVFGGGLLKMIGTLQNVQGGGGMQSVPGALLGIFGLSESHGVAIALGVLLVAVCIWLLRRVWQGQMDWLEGAAWATVGLLVTAGQLLPWYVSWLIPIVALTTRPRLRQAAMWMTAVGVVIGVANFLPNGLTFLRV